MISEGLKCNSTLTELNLGGGDEMEENVINKKKKKNETNS